MRKQCHNISNDFLSCSINELGAEIVSLKSLVTDREYMWQADPQIWAGSAPILFPIVGRLNTGQYSIDGQYYTLPTHGFIKDQSFVVTQKTDSSMTFSVQDSAATLASYPFKFQLNVTFSLDQKSLDVSYEIINQDKTPLYFAIGSHPAFALPQTEFVAQKCQLIFSDQENLHCNRIENNLLSEENYPVEFSQKTLLLTPSLFEQDALVFRDICSSSITLSVNDTPILSLEMGNNKHLGIWAKPNAAYVCIEPWISTDENKNTPLELRDKPDMTCLLPEKTYVNDYRINIF